MTAASLKLVRPQVFYFGQHGATHFHHIEWVDLPDQTGSAPADAGGELTVSLQQSPATQQQRQQSVALQRPSATQAVTSAVTAAADHAAASRDGDESAADLDYLQEPLGGRALEQVDAQDILPQQSAQVGPQLLPRSESGMSSRLAAMPSQQAHATAQSSSMWPRRQYGAPTAPAQPLVQQRLEGGSSRGTSATARDPSAGPAIAAPETTEIPRQLSPPLSVPSLLSHDGLRQTAAGSVQAVLETQQPDLTAAVPPPAQRPLPLPSQPPPASQPRGTQRSAVSASVRESELSTQPVSQLRMHAMPPCAPSSPDRPQCVSPQQTQLPPASHPQGATLPRASRDLVGASAQEPLPMLASQQPLHSTARQGQQQQAHRQPQPPVRQQRQQGEAARQNLKAAIEIPEEMRDAVINGLLSAEFSRRTAKRGLQCALRELKPGCSQWQVEERAVMKCHMITAENKSGCK